MAYHGGGIIKTAWHIISESGIENRGGVNRAISWHNG